MHSAFQREKGRTEKRASAEKVVREIRRKTRRRLSAEKKSRIVIAGLQAAA